MEYVGGTKQELWWIRRETEERGAYVQGYFQICNHSHSLLPDRISPL